MYIYDLRFKVKPSLDMVVPPFTSKVSRLILYRLLGPQAGLVKRGVSLKPVITTPLFDGGRALYKDARGGGSLTLKGGREYWFRAVLVGEKFGGAMVRLVDGGSVEAFGVEVDVRARGRALSFDKVGFRGGEDFKARFLTPTLLQLPKAWRGEGERHVLFPLPSLIVRSLVEHWNKHCPNNLKIKGESSLVGYSNHYLVEVDYDLKPVTVVYDGVRRPRAFVGWIIYKLRRRRERDRRAEAILRLLDYANYVGIGRSRSVGFGQVEVTAAGGAREKGAPRGLVEVEGGCQKP